MAQRGRPRRRVDALVTDAHTRAAVAGVRALGKAGLRSLVLGANRSAPALWSRHPHRRALAPRADEPGFVERVAELAVAHGPLVVHPSMETTLDPLMAGRATLPPEAILPYASTQALATLRHKPSLTALADAAGLCAPATLAVGTVQELTDDLPPTPCAVKAAGRSPALGKTRLIETPAELRALLARLPASDALIVQEQARGPLVGLALVLDRDGRVVARFQQVSLRLWPVKAGGSSLAVSVDPDPDLVERAAAVLRAAGHWGLAHLQFLSVERGPALIDVNARYYGSMPLATAAGVNLPALWHAVALGESLPEPPRYRAGVRYRWFEGDVFAALKGERGHLRRGGPRPDAGAMWASDDPLAAGLLAAQACWSPFRQRLPIRALRLPPR